jgi:hypothetical protein
MPYTYLSNVLRKSAPTTVYEQGGVQATAQLATLEYWTGSAWEAWWLIDDKPCMKYVGRD